MQLLVMYRKSFKFTNVARSVTITNFFWMRSIFRNPRVRRLAVRRVVQSLHFKGLQRCGYEGQEIGKVKHIF